MKTYTQLLNELKLPKPKHREKFKAYVRGLRNEPMANDPLVGKEMSDSHGYVRGKFPPQNPETGQRPKYFPPRTSTKPKYRIGFAIGNPNPAYVQGTLTKPERTELDAHMRGIHARKRIDKETDPEKIRAIKRKRPLITGITSHPDQYDSVHGEARSAVLNRPPNRLIKKKPSN